MIRQFCPEIQTSMTYPNVRNIKLKNTTPRERIFELYGLCEKEWKSLNKKIELKQADNIRAPFYLHFNSYKKCLLSLTDLYTPDAFRVTQENDIEKLKAKLLQNQKLTKFFVDLQKTGRSQLPEGISTIQRLTDQGWKIFHKKNEKLKKELAEAKKKSRFPTGTVIKVGAGGLGGTLLTLFTGGFLHYLLKSKK